MLPRPDHDPALTDLLEKVYHARGWDFRNYKRTSLMRRVSKRLNALSVGSMGEYSRFLEADPSEYNRLFSSVTIKVSEFFREPEVFHFLCKLLKSDYRDTAVKAWCCGCAFGEEAYSLAITLTECLGAEAIKNTKVFATDIDPEAVEQARRARYREESLWNADASVRGSHFFPVNGGVYKVKYGIRNLVKFGALDIVRNPPIAKVQILFCRNLFIYFNKTLQEDVFEKLDYSLRPGGLLVLGKAEVVPQRFSSRYPRIDKRISVYRKAE
ncbi:MAG: protein-glutamate O-methyltransferase CheR [Deltaproteobacteria bacterium]|nr:protein-glutamate O-methyltransferase CheR [Deltaproteobacteria bacterium]